MHADKDEGGGFGSFLGTFVLGAATGAAVALLTAPHSGRKTREWLKDTAQDLGESMERIPGALKQAGSKAIRAGQEVFGQAKEDLAQGFKMDDHRSRTGPEKYNR